MKRAIVILLILAFALPVMAGEFKFHTEPELDKWSLGHFAEGAGWYTFFRVITINPLASWCLSLVAGVGVESYVDGLQNELFGYGPDERGFSPWDIGFQVLGSSTALIFEAALKVLNLERRIKVYQSQNGVKAVIEL